MRKEAKFCLRFRFGRIMIISEFRGLSTGKFEFRSVLGLRKGQSFRC